jgi:hypothetical protein
MGPADTRVTQVPPLTPPHRSKWPVTLTPSEEDSGQAVSVCNRSFTSAMLDKKALVNIVDLLYSGGVILREFSGGRVQEPSRCLSLATISAELHKPNRRLRKHALMRISITRPRWLMPSARATDIFGTRLDDWGGPVLMLTRPLPKPLYTSSRPE